MRETANAIRKQKIEIVNMTTGSCMIEALEKWSLDKFGVVKPIFDDSVTVDDRI